MGILSFIVDTNVLVENFKFYKDLCFNAHKYEYVIYISKIVIKELDGLKKEHWGARKAINNLLANKNQRVFIEGVFQNEFIDVIIEENLRINAEKNDDKLLNFALTKENPILLTDDNVLLLKCQMHKVSAYSTKNVDLSTFFYNLGLKRKKDHSTKCKIDYFTVYEQILKSIEQILYKEYGNFLALDIYGKDFDNIIDLIIENFFVFKKYISIHSKKYFVALKKAYKRQDKEEFDFYLQKVALVFTYI
ncbi:hypothetical protein EHP00_934 [Ecytonucleospora hepatopenaei]|uniref:PIN domain-containing protein n=1 Tax=Ecytonucleospora hepatopenaei TaxID=646526 RepID=A0A1W0E6Z9_9MICR|nr:hypothetical protein EHP00_934 [Ecytonucleospora hepatopenaei]